MINKPLTLIFCPTKKALKTVQKSTQQQPSGKFATRFAVRREGNLDNIKEHKQSSKDDVHI